MMTKNKPYTPQKAWNKRVDDAVAILDKAEKKLIHKCSHTADGVKVKKGLKVFLMGDLSLNKQYRIEEVSEQIFFKRNITLSCGEEISSAHSSTLYCDQKKAIEATIKDIKRTEKSILRDMKENIERLDAVNRVKELQSLKRKLKKSKNNV